MGCFGKIDDLDACFANAPLGPGDLRQRLTIGSALIDEAAFQDVIARDVDELFCPQALKPDKLFFEKLEGFMMGLVDFL